MEKNLKVTRGKGAINVDDYNYNIIVLAAIIKYITYYESKNDNNNNFSC